MIRIIDDWYLRVDSRQFVVGKARLQKKNRRTSLQFVHPSYYPTVTAAFEHVLNMEVRAMVADGTITDLHELVSQFNAVKDALLMASERIFDELKKKKEARKDQ